MPFQHNETEDVENFTLRRNQLHLLKGKPTFKNGGFYSVQQNRNEQRKSVPSFLTLPRNKNGQRHFLQGRGITLPRIDSSNTSDNGEKFGQLESDESDSSSESDLDLLMLGNVEKRKIPQRRRSSDLPQLPRIHPLELLEARRKFGIADDDSSSSTDESNYYNEIVMSNFKLQQSDSQEKMTSNTYDHSDDVFIPQKETTYCTLNLDKTFVYDSKRNTLERMTGREKYPDLSTYESTGLGNFQAKEPRSGRKYNKEKDVMNSFDIDITTPDCDSKESLSSKSYGDPSTKFASPSVVQLKSALKSRSLQHDQMKRKSPHTPKTASLDRHGKLLYGYENRGFVDEKRMLNGEKHDENVFARQSHPLDTIDELPITLIL